MTNAGDTEPSHWPSQLCRLCAENRTEFIGIYEPEGLRLDIHSKIVKCLRIQVFINDNLPLLVCLECYRLLNQSYEFYEKTDQAQHSLHQIFSKHSSSLRDGTIQDTHGSIENSEACHMQGREAISIQDLHSAHDAINPCAQESRNLINNDHQNIEKNGTANDCRSITEHVASDIEETNISLLRQRLLQMEKSKTDNYYMNEVDGDLTIDEDMKGDVKIPVDYMTGTEADIKMIIETKSCGNSEQMSARPKKKKGQKMDRYPWLCTDCNDKLPSLKSLQDHHTMVHNQKARYMCVQCSKVFEKYYGFLTHVNRHVTRAKFSCEDCSRTFADKKILDSHRATHSEARPHVCQNCGKTFKQKSALHIHTRCHLPENMRDKFPCEVCGKRFTTKPNLVTHTRIHTGVRNYICDQCGKRFIQKGNLEAHCKIHTVEKPYKCLACSKAFKTPMQLKKHETVHTGSKPYRCDVCDRSFREKGTLREHHRIHTGAMPFSCEFCGKRFRFKGILTTHRRQHTGERPYSCEDCQHHFTNWPNYNKHMKRRHGIDTSISKQKPDQKQPSPIRKKPKVQKSQETVQQHHQIHNVTDASEQPMTVTATTVQVIQTVPPINISHPILLQSFPSNAVTAIQTIVETTESPISDSCRQIDQLHNEQTTAMNTIGFRERGNGPLCSASSTAYFNTVHTPLTNFLSPTLPYSFYNVSNVTDDTMILPE